MVFTIKVFATILSAFGLNRFYEPSKALGERWGNMLREAIGIIGLWPFVLLLVREIPRNQKREDDTAQRYTVAYLLAAMFFGAGVLLGHLFTRLEKNA